MTEMAYSLLDEPLFAVTQDGEPTDASLPQILAGLSVGSLTEFRRLQAHQKQPWYCFLVQIAAMALARNEREGLPVDPAEWRQLLLSLSDGADEAWCLVVEDVTRPAFMQSPVPEGSLKKAKYSSSIRTPDEMDILITAKNHDVKQNRVDSPSVEHWIYGLVTLQTLQGFLGRGNYGIVRMNGGFSSRPFVGLAPGLGWAERYRRDVTVCLNRRSDLFSRYNFDSGGYAVLWTVPWSGAKDDGIALAECDPYFVEICRRVRFIGDEEGLNVVRANTKGSRIDAPKDLNGVTGDPWTPIAKAEAKALTLSGQGFHYRLLRQLLLSEEYESSVAMDFDDKLKNDGGYLIAACLVRGQGKTEGYFEREVPIPARAVSLFGTPDGRTKLFQIADSRVERAAEVRQKILYPSLRQLLAAGSNNDVESERIQPWTNAFDSDVDAVFFERIWEAVELEEDQARGNWEAVLYKLARSQLDAAIRSAPLPSARRYRAISRAESIFEGSARKRLTTYFRKSEEAQA